jgi:hypothetical protein
MLDDRLDRLSRQIVRARVLYDLWWLCAAKETRESYRAAFNRYGEFFRFLEHGLLVATVVQASIPFDGSKGTLSLSRAINDLVKEGALSVVDGKALTVRLGKIAESIAAIRTLRHNAFAHLSHSVGYDEAFTKAGLRPMDIRAVIDEAMQVINALLTARGLDTVCRNTFAAEDGLSLLQEITSSDEQSET